MKKSISVIVCLFILLVSVLFVPASAEQPPLLPYALELIENLHELAADEVFFYIVNGGGDRDELDAMAATDCTDFRGGCLLTAQEAVLEFYFNTAFDLAGLSEQGRKIVKGMVFSSLPNQWNARRSSKALAQSSIVSCSGVYTEPEGFEACAMILDCGGALYYVSFSKLAEGFIQGRVSPLFSDEGYTAETGKTILSLLPFFSLTPILP